MPSCKDCVSHKFDVTTRIGDTRRLYNPTILGIHSGKGSSTCRARNSKCGTQTICGRQSRNSCSSCPSCNRIGNCSKRECCNAGFGDEPVRCKNYWEKNFEPAGLCIYEKQPWYRDPIIREEWNGFIGDVITPDNIQCYIQPGHDEYQFKYNKVRSLIEPSVCCTWDLPDQDECATIRYGVNRDWRRYNEDQRIQYTDFKCGCVNEPVCLPKRCEWPPYLGKMYGARYMAWANAGSFMYPRNLPYNWQSRPTVC